MKTITIEQWDNADIVQRGKWLDDKDILLDEEGLEILIARLEDEEKYGAVRITD